MTNRFVEDQERLLQSLGGELSVLPEGPLEEGDVLSMEVHEVAVPALRELGARWRFRVNLARRDGSRQPFVVRPSISELVTELHRLCKESADRTWTGLRYRLWIDGEGAQYDCHFLYGDAEESVH